MITVGLYLVAVAGANEPLSAAKQSMWAFGQSANDFLRQTVQKYQYQMARPSPQSTQSVESARDELSNMNSDSDASVSSFFVT